jgi:hypothetical protein
MSSYATVPPSILPRYTPLDTRETYIASLESQISALQVRRRERPLKIAGCAAIFVTSVLYGWAAWKMAKCDGVYVLFTILVNAL